MEAHVEFAGLLAEAAGAARDAERAALASARRKSAAAAGARAALRRPETRPAPAEGWRAALARLFGDGKETAPPAPRMDREEVRRLASQAKSASAAAAKMTASRAALEEAAAASKGFGLPGSAASARMEEARPFVLAAARRKPFRLSVFSQAAMHATAAVNEWRLSEKKRVLSDRPGVPKHAAPRPDVAKERVWLPIPFATGRYARAAGAGYDGEAGSGSRWYVPPGKPLADFEQWLPLAWRRRAPELTFPPVRHQASSQNLWSVFDRDTWNQIRHINYERTGRRCALCGKRSGKLLEVLEGENAREGTVDCHEIWEWKVPDPASSLGVQKLKGMVVVCFECHMVFHEGFARSAARGKGIEDEVRRFLMKRRSFLTRKHPVQVATEMQAEAAKLRKHSGVRMWIMDLENLGRQDYMSQIRPVFVEDNVPGVRPGQVAGLSFVTDRGREWPAVDAAKLYGSLADLYRAVPDSLREGGRVMRA